MIETIMERIQRANHKGHDQYDQGWLDGHISAYEDVLKMLGFYDDDGQPRYQREN